MARDSTGGVLGMPVEVVEHAGADVGDEGSGEEQHEPGSGGDPEGAQAEQPEQEPGHSGAFEHPERHQPGPWHADFSHGGEDESGRYEIGDGGPRIGQDRDDRDDHVRSKHFITPFSPAFKIKPRQVPAWRPIHASIT